MGRSYDTTSGKVLAMWSEDDVTVTTASLKPAQLDWTFPASATDDVIIGGQLVTIMEAKTPTSPLEPPAAGCDIIDLPETRREGGGACVVSSPLTLPQSPLGESSPSPRVV